MLRLLDEYWEPIQFEIENIFKSYFEHIIYYYDLDRDLLNNASNFDLLKSYIISGKVRYANGVFRGEFNSKVSSELRKFCIFDGRTKTFLGKPPFDLLTTILIVEDRFKKTNDKLLNLLPEINKQIDANIENLQFTYNDTLFKIDEQFKKDISSVGISPSINIALNEKLVQSYNLSTQRYIKNWNQEQIERLRYLIKNVSEKGYNKNELISLIEGEWGVTRNKAKFLARQETSLFLSDFRRERYLDAGVRKYKWSTSHDIRVRPSNKFQKESGEDHKYLNGQIFEFGKPPIVNKKTGKRAEPGEDFGCRCVAIPEID